ncbi:hypothetical protein [Acidovorax sp.]|uniref:hypothetical protein n=1 Tax=Acidovorax sp. TaxID=1872122 RepID=UPI0025B9FF0B|nr:hypothetical protein [Acidovorax sp.]MCI5070141.1 hypothetical protein [Acidovorax sp.]
MPSYVKDTQLRNLVITDDCLKELDNVLQERVHTLNDQPQADSDLLISSYVVRFDSLGYRTYSWDEAWSNYQGAAKVERVVLAATSLSGQSTNFEKGARIELRLDKDAKGSSHLIVSGDNKDWVNTSFSTLESVLKRRRDLATMIVRTQWTILVLQLGGVFAGILLAIWLATKTAPILQGIEYPRATSFAFWLLVFSNMWPHLQQRLHAGLDALFPNVRFSRKGDHWVQTLIREGARATGIAVALWIFTWLTKWMMSVVGPFVNLGQ